MENKKEKVNIISPLEETVVIADDSELKTGAGEYINTESMEVLTETEEIEALKQRQSMDILKNELLGHFNAETGKYEISDDIKQELCQIIKKQDEVRGNAIFASSVSNFNGFGKFKFVIKTSAENELAESRLYIYESIAKEGGTVENLQVHLVSDFKLTDKAFKSFGALNYDNYFKVMYAEFNIITDFADAKLEEAEEFLNGWILRRKTYLRELNSEIAPILEEAEEELLVSRIEILTKLGPYGYEVLQKYEENKSKALKMLTAEYEVELKKFEEENKSLKKKGDIKKEPPKKPQLKAKDLNEILETAVENARGKYPKPQQEYFKKQLPVVIKVKEKIEKVKAEKAPIIKEKVIKKVPAKSMGGGKTAKPPAFVKPGKYLNLGGAPAGKKTENKKASVSSPGVTVFAKPKTEEKKIEPVTAPPLIKVELKPVDVTINEPTNHQRGVDALALVTAAQVADENLQRTSEPQPLINRDEGKKLPDRKL